MKSNERVLEDLVTEFKEAKGIPAETPAPEPDRIEDGGDGTLVGGKVLGRVPSQRDAHGARGQEIEFKTLETEPAGKPRAEDAEHSNWVRPHINAYVPVSNVGGGRGPSAQPAYAAVPAPQNSRPDAQQSFVLSNVFAGCPLEVKCAASWKCIPQGQAECLYIIVGVRWTGVPVGVRFFLSRRVRSRDHVYALPMRRRRRRRLAS